MIVVPEIIALLGAQRADAASNSCIRSGCTLNAGSRRVFVGVSLALCAHSTRPLPFRRKESCVTKFAWRRAVPVCVGFARRTANTFSGSCGAVPAAQTVRAGCRGVFILVNGARLAAITCRRRVSGICACRTIRAGTGHTGLGPLSHDAADALGTGLPVLIVLACSTRSACSRLSGGERAW